MSDFLKHLIQNQLNKRGYRISKMEDGVSPLDAYIEQERLLQKSKVKIVFDVGAADGADSIRYHQMFPNATIYCFEPLPDSFKKLEKVASDKAYIVPMNYALSDTIGEADFHVTNLHDASSLLMPRQSGSSFDRHTVHKKLIQVKTTTLNEFCKMYAITNIDLLKMDAQGAELLILQGGSDLLDSQRIDLIYSEVNFFQIYKDMALLDDITGFLKSKNYFLFNLYNMIHNQKGQLSWGDAIFLSEKLRT